MGVATWLIGIAAGLLAIIGIGYAAEKTGAGQGLASLGQGIGSGFQGLGQGAGAGIQGILSPLENLSSLFQQFYGKAASAIGSSGAGNSSGGIGLLPNPFTYFGQLAPAPAGQSLTVGATVSGSPTSSDYHVATTPTQDVVNKLVGLAP